MKKLFAIILIISVVLIMPVLAFATTDDQNQNVDENSLFELQEKRVIDKSENISNDNQLTEKPIKESLRKNAETDEKRMNQEIAVSGVKLDQNSLNMSIGETIQLGFTIEPDNATNRSVRWSSNDESVATVKDGIVTAVSPGRTSIVILTEDGEYSDVCNVLVKDVVDSGSCGSGVKWSVSGNENSYTLTISGKGEMGSYFWVDDVTTAPWGKYANDIVEIRLLEGVKNIGRSAFAGLTKVKKIYIPKSLSSIGGGAFSYARSAELFNIYITDLDAWCNMEFSGYPSWQKHLLFLDGKELTDFTIPLTESKTLGYSFSNCISIKKVTVSNGYTTIGKQAFAYCSKLEEITIPDSVNVIDEYAFFYCSSLTGIDLPNKINTIQQYTFSSCNSISSMVIPDGVTKIANRSLPDSCTLLAIPDSVRTIEDSAWGYSTASRYVVYYGKKLRWSSISMGKYNGMTRRFEVAFDNTSFSYTGNAIEPSVSIAAVSGNNSVALTQNHDYSIGYLNNTNAGKALVELSFLNDYSYGGTIQLPFFINPINANKVTINEIPDSVYTGDEITPKLEITLGDQTLEEGIDYRVDYRNNIDAGNATATVTYIGNYSGTASVDFVIKPVDATNAVVEDINDQPYSGEAIQPAVSVEVNGRSLVAGRDYNISYFNNVNVGNASAQIVFIGNYSRNQALQVPFKITKRVNSWVEEPLVEDTIFGNVVVPKGKAAYGDVVFRYYSDSEGTRLIDPPMERGVYYLKAIVNEGDTFCGITSDCIRFEIVRAPLFKVALSNSEYTYNGNTCTPAVIVTDGRGRVLIKGVDYDVSYPNNRKAVGKYAVTVKGVGDYCGTLIANYSISPARVVIASVTLPYSRLIVKAKNTAASYGAGGFQIAYKVEGGKWKYVNSIKQSTSIQNIVKNRKYYVKLRAYRKIGDNTYYGAWSVQRMPANSTIKVSFNANKGRIGKKKKTKSVKIFSKYGQLPKPTRKRFKFRGWYTKKSGGIKVTTKTNTLYFKNHTLYARWFGPKGKGKKISKAEYKRIDYGMSYSDVCFLIGGSGNRISSYTDRDWIDNSHYQTVNDGYWDDGQWIDTSYEEYVDDGYWEEHYHETYSFRGKRSGVVHFEFVDDALEEIYTYSFK